jgi:hypothetical protein
VRAWHKPLVSAALIALLVAVIAATASLPAWTIPIRIGGWAVIVWLLAAMRHGDVPGLAGRESLNQFRQPVPRRDARRYLLTVSVPALVLLALSIVWRYV